MPSKPPYLNWANAISLINTRVIRPPTYIFICGGKASKDDNHITSCRSLFYKYVKDNSCQYKDDIIFAEEIFDYYTNSPYKDLLRFEEDIAHLSALTLVFSESPGSIAELGAFSVIESIRKRLLVVFHDRHSNKKSFIWQGIADHLKQNPKSSLAKKPVLVYNWPLEGSHTNQLSTRDFHGASNLNDEINKILKGLKKISKFNKGDPCHLMLLVLDVLKMVQIASLVDISKILNALRVCTSRNTIRQRLSLLESVKLVIKKQYGNQTFFLPKREAPRLKWAYKSIENCKDDYRWISRIREYYKKTETKKEDALNSYLRTA